MTLIDSIPGLPAEHAGERLSVTKELAAEFCDKLREASRRSELFLVESPLNNYQPPPPEGYKAFRSYKQRLFIKGHSAGESLEEALKHCPHEFHPL